MARIVSVKLVKPFGCLNAGEEAGFNEDVADELVSKGLATHLKQASPVVDKQAIPTGTVQAEPEGTKAEAEAKPEAQEPGSDAGPEGGESGKKKKQR